MEEKIFSTVEETVSAIKAGKMVIVVDDEVERILFLHLVENLDLVVIPFQQFPDLTNDAALRIGYDV